MMSMNKERSSSEMEKMMSMNKERRSSEMEKMMSMNKERSSSEMEKMMSMNKERSSNKMKKMMKKEEGFTLVELLIVVIILGILAAVAIPQFGSSTDDAKLSTLQSNLSGLRNAVELYKSEHNSVYPGEMLETDGTTVTSAAQCIVAFTKQLTLYSDIPGVTAVGSSPGAKGPYMKKGALPANPFNQDNTVVCDKVLNDITTVATDGSSGWLFYTQTGRLVANDGNHDTE
jgi:prepilin-type N-terminal cleavage/methylation domain-containing protein